MWYCRPLGFPTFFLPFPFLKPPVKRMPSLRRGRVGPVLLSRLLLFSLAQAGGRGHGAWMGRATVPPTRFGFLSPSPLSSPHCSFPLPIRLRLNYTLEKNLHKHTVQPLVSSTLPCLVCILCGGGLQGSSHKAENWRVLGGRDAPTFLFTSNLLGASAISFPHASLCGSLYSERI